MFRESDRPERIIHPTYAHKPVPVLQSLSQASKFDDSGVASNAYKENNHGHEIPAIPSSWDNYYDPNHPDADWTGLVSKANNHRKHVEGHSSQNVGVVHAEHGIVSKEEKQEWTHRRQPENRQSKNESSITIAGINEDETRWKTTYKSFEAREKTAREQMTLEKRARPVKIIPDPAQARSQREYPVLSPRCDIEAVSNNNSSLVGYRAPMFTKKSMISNIGSDIASRIDIAPYELSRTAATNKAPDTLLTQNFNPHPGYTGKRKF